MTREQALRETACMVMDWTAMTDQDVSDLRIPLKLALAIARRFADAEAAAMRERAAEACEEQAKVFLSPKYATGQPLSSMMERFACGQCAEAIRALPATGEVGRG